MRPSGPWHHDPFLNIILLTRHRQLWIRQHVDAAVGVVLILDVQLRDRAGVLECFSVPRELPKYRPCRYIRVPDFGSHNRILDPKSGSRSIFSHRRTRDRPGATSSRRDISKSSGEETMKAMMLKVRCQSAPTASVSHPGASSSTIRAGHSFPKRAPPILPALSTLQEQSMSQSCSRTDLCIPNIPAASIDLAELLHPLSVGTADGQAADVALPGMIWRLGAHGCSLTSYFGSNSRWCVKCGEKRSKVGTRVDGD